MIEFLENITNNRDYLIVALLTAFLIAEVLDWSFGWLNARFNPEVEFESGIALFGIIKKMMYFIGVAFFSVVSFLIVPTAVAYAAVITLLIGMIASELSSIAAHMGWAKDGKKGEVLKDFLARVFENDKGKGGD